MHKECDINYTKPLEWLQGWLQMLQNTKTIPFTLDDWANLKQPITGTLCIRKRIIIMIQSHLKHLSLSQTMFINHAYFYTPEIGQVFYKLRSKGSIVVFLPTTDEYYEIEMDRLF